MNLPSLDEIHYALDAASFAREVLHFHPSPQQEALLEARVNRLVLNCCRQWGESTIASVRAVHQALTVPNSTILVVAPTLRQAGETIRKSAQFLRDLGFKLGSDPMNRPSIVLPNKSRIIGLPPREDNIRGFTPSFVIADEAARIPDEIWKAIRPMLARNPEAPLWLLSTPKGRRGFFFEHWQLDQGAWLKVKGPVTDCPWVSQAFLDEERAELSESEFAQEYLCEFLQTEQCLLRDDDLLQAFSPHIEPLLTAAPVLVGYNLRRIFFL